VLNAVSLRERLAREHEQLQRVGGAHSLCCVDLDGLKRLVERYGATTGDAALREVAQVLKSAVRGSDLVGRVGHDEFLLLFHDCPLAIAEARCRGLLEAIAERPLRMPNGGEEPLRLSIGLTLLRGVDPDAESAIERADAACFAARHGGGHRVEIR